MSPFVARQLALALLLGFVGLAACGIETEGASVSNGGTSGTGGNSGVAGGGGFPTGGAGGGGATGGTAGGAGGAGGPGGTGGVADGGGGLDAGDASDGPAEAADVVDAGPLAPKDIPGLALWLRSDVGVTTLDAAVASPTALGDVAWTKTNCTTTAQTLTESVDITPKSHMASQLVPNLQLGHSAHFSIGVPAASGGGRYPAVVPNGGAGVVLVDAQAGAILKAVGVSSATYAGGVLEFDTTVTSQHLGLYVTADGVNLTHTGNGTHTASFTSITVKQRSVSAWADQSGKGHDASQGTDGIRPLFVAPGLGGA